MGNSVGTIRKVVLNGITFDVFADTKISFNRSGFEIEGQATTGKTLYKMTKRVRTIESLDLATSPSDMESLKELSESLADITMSVELADASIYKSTGRVFFDKYESETGKSSVQLIPAGDWTAFLAE